MPYMDVLVRVLDATVVEGAIFNQRDYQCHSP